MPLESVHGNGKGRSHAVSRVDTNKVTGGGKYTLKELDILLGDSSNQDKASANGNQEEPLVKYEILEEKVREDSPQGHIEEDVPIIPENEDIAMMDLDTEQNVTMVSDYLSGERSNVNLTMSNDTVDQWVSNTNNVQSPTQLQTVFVLDTNFIISHLNTLESLRSTFKEYHHLIIIPSYTIRELDGLKNSDKVIDTNSQSNHKNDTTIGELARSSNTWIYKHLANTASGVMGQKLRQRLDPQCVKDDAILDCCLYFKTKMECFVILLSNDKNLCLRALTEDILTVSYRKGMTGELIASKAHEENLFRFGHGSVNDRAEITNVHNASYYETPGEIQVHNALPFSETSQYIFDEIKKILLVAVNYVMFEEFGEEIQHVDFDPKELSSYNNVSKCLYHYWVAVFTEYFKTSRIRKDDWKDLPEALLMVPADKATLDIFEPFWKDILEHLFMKRNDDDNLKLEALFNEWDSLIKKLETI